MPFDLSDREWNRLWATIGEEDERGCWPWLNAPAGVPKTHPYGQFWYGGRANGRRVMAHRAVYMVMVEDIPDGLQLDHLCRNTMCVNPQHLEPVTHRENQIRGEGFVGRNARKEVCLRGHPFQDGDIGADGARFCRECRRVNALATHYRNRDRILANRRERRRNGKRN